MGKNYCKFSNNLLQIKKVPKIDEFQPKVKEKNQIDKNSFKYAKMPQINLYNTLRKLESQCQYNTKMNFRKIEKKKKIVKNASMTKEIEKDDFAAKQGNSQLLHRERNITSHLKTYSIVPPIEISLPKIGCRIKQGIKRHAASRTIVKSILKQKPSLLKYIKNNETSSIHEYKTLKNNMPKSRSYISLSLAKKIKPMKKLHFENYPIIEMKCRSRLLNIQEVITGGIIDTIH